MNWIEYPVTTKELGCIVDEESIAIRVWAPGCEEVDLAIYNGPDHVRRTLYAMKSHTDGVFEYTLDGSFLGKYYTFILDHKEEVTDPYSLGVSQNSTKSAIMDPNRMDPPGWKEHVESQGSVCINCLDAVIYEVHVKDFTIDPSSGVELRGKYLGMGEKGTTCNNLATGLDHLKELGVTHIHLMPVFDFLTVDERPEAFYQDENYNWGYDPEHYNVPEGSYATNTKSPYTRIHELKQLIMTLQKEGFAVIMDVVYNHTFRGVDSNLNRLAPDYYFRTWPDGTWSDGSGCGNELATERYMTRRLLYESLEYWMEAFNLDGFRFDLMALIDIDTIHHLVERLQRKKENIFIYGEPWTGRDTVLPNTMRTTKGKQISYGFAFLNDNFRDAVKGDCNGTGWGFVQGCCDFLHGVQTGLAGSIYYDDGHIGFGATSEETINYINSHDNLILYDKMKKTFPDAPESFIDRLNRLSLAMLFFAQGIPMIHAGNEFMRGKNMHNNSYNAPISVNRIDWNKKKENLSFFKFTKDLITFRRRHIEFRLRSTEDIKENLRFCDLGLENCQTLGFTIRNPQKPEQFLFAVIHGASVDRLITRKFLTEHLSKNYGVHFKHICIDQLFDFEGIISLENRENNMDPHGILLNSYDCAVFRITEACPK